MEGCGRTEAMDLGCFGMLLGIAIAAPVLPFGCAQTPLDYPRTASFAVSIPETTRLGRLLAPQFAAHPGQTGFHLLADGPTALAARLALIDAAERTVDAQCSLLADDSVGNLFLDRVIQAADRGVRVRLLMTTGNSRGTTSDWPGSAANQTYKSGSSTRPAGPGGLRSPARSMFS